MDLIDLMDRSIRSICPFETIAKVQFRRFFSDFATDFFA